MKKYITLLAAALCLASCSFLEVPLESSVSTSNFYKTEKDFELGLTGVYNTLITTDWNARARYGNYFQGFLILTRVGTDELYCGYDNGHGEAEISNYTYTPTNEYISRTWFVMFKGIQRANTIIDRIADADINATSKNRIVGEALFLRSFFYFHLVRLYREVPLVVHETIDIANMDLTKASVAGIYAQIAEDLKNASELLPDRNDNGHPGKYAAKAMLGKVYLQMAGEPLKDASAAALAEEQLADVINSGMYALEENFFEMFDGKHEYGPEYIWDIEFANNGNTTYGGQVGTPEGPSNEASLYWVLLRSAQEFYETFDPKDKRINSIARFRLVYDENQNLVEEYWDEDPEGDWFYFAYKFRHALTEEGRGSGWANWANPINFPIIRYADVLLMYAEAQLRAKGSASAEALEYVNQVRRRGYEKDIKTPNVTVDRKSLSLDDILEERSFELCFEGQRWYDLSRFGKLEEGVKKLSVYPITLAGTTQAQNFKPKHVVLPVPQDVIDASNGAIEQNELWK